MSGSDWDVLDAAVTEMVEGQKAQLLRLGRRFVPTLTPEDMLQPNDYPELETHSEFRYEEGVLAGLLSVQTALRALAKESG